MNRIVYLAAIISAAMATSVVGSANPYVLNVAKEQTVPKLKTVTLPFDLDRPLKKNEQVRLIFKVRVEYPDCANNKALVITVNGKDIVGDDLINKPLQYTDKNGRMTFWALPKGVSWYLYSWPDFSLINAWASTNPYSISRQVDPFEFAFDITDLVKKGQNSIGVTHNEIVANLNHYLVLRDVRIEVGRPTGVRGGLLPLPAPTGSLTTYVPQAVQKVRMNAELSSGGTIRLEAGGQSAEIKSRSSDPAGSWKETTGGAWQHISVERAATSRWLCKDYSVKRNVTIVNDHLHIADTFTNTGSKLIGVMYEDRIALNDSPLEIKLAGKPPYEGEGYFQEYGGANPTVLARWRQLAIGLVAEDDIFRSHAQEFSTADAVGLADHELGIVPGQSHTVEWSIYPVSHGDYWDFINAVRRNWKSNFTLSGACTFVDWSTVGHDEDYYRKWLALRGLRIVSSFDAMYDGGYAAMGTAIPLAKMFDAQTAQWIKQVHAVAPGVKALVYMNASMSTEPNASIKYSDSRLLNSLNDQPTIAAGSPKGITMAPVFICTLNNSYGDAMMKVAKYIIENLGADGLYHDIFTLGEGYAQRAYHTAWDGCTVTIDPNTHEVTGKSSSVVLLVQPWEKELIGYLRDRGKIFIANGAVETRTLSELQIPTFVENCSSFSDLYETHLGSPWGYGNYPPQDPQRDIYYNYAYELRKMLDYGVILNPPVWLDDPSGVTFLQLIYPITPLELRPGIVFGEERILTNRSGRYGWNDESDADIYVFDGDGKVVNRPLVKKIHDGNKSLFEIRMPSDQFAILVRKKKVNL